MIIDAHVHLWKEQKGIYNASPVVAIGGGKSSFGEQIRQMLPPYMTDGINCVERLIANMDYARVSAAVVTQEYIDGNQDDYLRNVKSSYNDRIKICNLYQENANYQLEGFDGIKICAGRLSKEKLIDTLPVFQWAEKMGKFVSIDLADGDTQVFEMEQIIKQCPKVKIAIGHFGMVTVEGWEEQIRLATYPNVYIESGGITWLFHKEFYPYPSAIEAIVRAKNICGMDKLMWGSDYPRTMTAITYAMSYDFILKTNRLTEHEKEQFLWKNAFDFYCFERLEELPYIKNMVE